VETGVSLFYNQQHSNVWGGEQTFSLEEGGMVKSTAEAAQNLAEEIKKECH
jgi:hypothetical protein